MRLIPLGTNGYFPSFGRQTMSILVLDGEMALLLDAGTGVGRLIEPRIREMLRSVARLDVMLSHYHLDHLIGLSYLGGVFPGPVRIYGPAPPLSDVSPEEALAVLGPPWFPKRLLDSRSVEVVAVSRKEWDLDRMPVRMRRQAHPGGSVGIRLGDRLAYCVDAAIDPGERDFLEGAEVLLHEVWLTDEEAAREPPERSGHSAAGPVAALAASAGVERLFPVHHHPKRNGPELEGLVRGMRREGITIELPREGAVLRLGKNPANA
ncbi:MAG: beta-lactamase domain protein [Deltaproteobacteria bacterium]|nr:beta-lactamase domain protein [Acidobacteriota bacterium]MBP2675820.1 beta-lactamase domain protein [Deltaproteobacteria bacterium]